MEYLFLLILLVWLFSLSAFDVVSFRLPDFLTFPLIMTGLIQSQILNDDIANATIGAVLGYSAFVIVELSFKRLKGVDGLGRGDAKLLAAGGAWCGWLWLPQIVLFSSASAIFAIIVMRQMSKKISKQTPIPFGPFIALAIFLVWTLRTFDF